MKAWVLNGIKTLEMTSVPKPRIQKKNDVLIQVKAVGVCGSDVHYYLTGRIGTQIVKYPFIIGHECAGIIREVGDQVHRVKPGDSVVLDPAISCLKCDQCKAGRYHTCRNLVFLGCPGQTQGCLCEYIVMPEENCYPVSSNINSEDSVIAEPISIGVYSFEQSGAKRGDAIGILGVGPIGLSVLIYAASRGMDKIYVTDKLGYRLEFASKVGTIRAWNPKTDNVVNEITNIEPHGLDVVFECCGDQEALDQAIELLKPGGTLAIVGIPAGDLITFAVHEIRRKEITIKNIRRQLNCMNKAMDLIKNSKINPAKMITHRFKFDNTPEAFDVVSNYKDGVIKAIITSL